MSSKGYIGTPTGYREVHVNMEAPKKERISMRKKLDRFCMIGIPTVVATGFAALMAWAAYCVKTHVWQHWTTVKETSTEVHYVSTGQYVHGMTTDIVVDIVFGLLALTVAVLCAYWAEAWYE